MKKEKGRRPLWKDLLLIPLQLAADVILLYAGAYLDTRIVSPQAHGHPTFALTILFTAAAGVMTAAVVLYVIVKVILYFFRKKKINDKV